MMGDASALTSLGYSPLTMVTAPSSDIATTAVNLTFVFVFVAIAKLALRSKMLPYAIINVFTTGFFFCFLTKKIVEFEF